MGHYLNRWNRLNCGHVQTQTGKDADGHWGTVVPDNKVLDKMLTELINELPQGFEIKAVLPLIGSSFYGTGLTNHHGAFGMQKTWGGGYGYSSSCTVGLVVLSQKWVDSDDAVATVENVALAPA